MNDLAQIIGAGPGHMVGGPARAAERILIPCEAVGDVAGRHGLVGALDGGALVQLRHAGGDPVAVQARAPTVEAGRAAALAWVERGDLPPADSVESRAWRQGQPGPGWVTEAGGAVQYGAEVGPGVTIGGRAEVYAGARVVDEAVVGGDCMVLAGGEVSGQARVTGGQVTGKVTGRAVVESSYIEGLVEDDARVTGSQVAAEAKVSDRAEVQSAKIRDRGRVAGDAKVLAWAVISGDGRAAGRCTVRQHAVVTGRGRAGGDAVLQGLRNAIGVGAAVLREGRLTSGVHPAPPG